MNSQRPRRSHRVLRALLIALAALVALLALGWLFLLRTVGPSSACRRPEIGSLLPGATSVRVVKSGVMDRCYWIHVPPDYSPDRPVPLVISLHGFAERAPVQEWLSQWDTTADAESFIVVYPEGLGMPLRWNIALAADVNKTDDVQFMRDLIAEVSGLASIDAERIYVNGISNGGAMTGRVACEMADVVAAVGMVSPLPLDPPSGCTPARPIPIIAFHGTADPVVLYEGGSTSLPGARPVTYPPVATWIAGWAKRNGCDPKPEALPRVADDVSGVRYLGCDDEVDVLFYTIAGGGHTWPGGSPIDVVGKTATSISADQMMWDFFNRYSLSGKDDEQ